jgi:hypothetical protein
MDRQNSSRRISRATVIRHQERHHCATGYDVVTPTPNVSHAHVL